MAPLSAQLLLQRGQPKCDRLSRIRRLDLSNMELRTGDLAPELFGRLKQLAELDLSDNQLEGLPPGLGLPRLRVLNCANNQLGDLTALAQFPLLEELTFEDNLYLTVNDNYKVSFLLPNLKKVNGRDTSALTDHVQVLNRELTSRVAAHWEKSFRARAGPRARAGVVRKDFMRSVLREVQYGPKFLSEFTQWRVKVIAEELLASHLSGGDGGQTSADPPGDSPEEAEGPEEAGSQETAPTPRKRKDLSSQTLSPVKRARSSPPSSVASIQLTPKRPSRQAPSSSQRPPPAGQSDGRTPPASAGEPAGTGADGEAGLSLEPLHLLQCHSKANSPDDFSTQLWACAFEPPLEPGPAGRPSHTVATAGGESVCVTDCESGLVLNKYKVPGEEFFTVAWTALTMLTADGRKKRYGVLAAAGRRGVVKLIHVRAGFCYGEIKAHRKPVATACFSPAHETHLYTASYDKRIILWDIGVPDCEYNFKASQLLVLEANSTPLRLCPAAPCPARCLLAGCEDGCLAWDVRLDWPQKRRGWEARFLLPEGPRPGGRRVDGLAFVDDDVVATKGGRPGSITLWSWSRSWPGSARSGPQQKVEVVILAQLQWADTDLPYLTLSACPEAGYLFCGDEEGSVWVYDVARCLRRQPRDRVPPTQILKWPALRGRAPGPEQTLINTVSADPSLTYLVAVTDTNITAIWKKQ
ncbi:leucine-rich repeat and WD repeat-containing protein 1 [Tachyglossus aculeatus]|uniref:leucine-rich repeat and WD repeat-containing protein 1 n=1 Tax=Tachyglossus aculeatus TaxID=9261 RepID=UPI0018F2BB65|nr:leucine-rich repeat and WD repeat-containing protein 1 [Tachyglossus aculeatus]